MGGSAWYGPWLAARAYQDDLYGRVRRAADYHLSNIRPAMMAQQLRGARSPSVMATGPSSRPPARRSSKPPISSPPSWSFVLPPRWRGADLDRLSKTMRSDRSSALACAGAARPQGGPSVQVREASIAAHQHDIVEGLPAAHGCPVGPCWMLTRDAQARRRPNGLGQAGVAAGTRTVRLRRHPGGRLASCFDLDQAPRWRDIQRR